MIKAEETQDIRKERSMKSEWKVTSQYISDVKTYQVYRRRDINVIDHSGNRDYAEGSFNDKRETEALAKKMNEEEVKCLM